MVLAPARSDRVRGRVRPGRSARRRGSGQALTLKLDENVPAHLSPALRGIGQDVDSVQSEELTGQSDAEVWAAAQRDGRFLITQDLDFSDATKYVTGSHLAIEVRRLNETRLMVR